MTRIRIETPDHLTATSSWRVFVDDVDISNRVTGVELRAFIHEAPRLVIHLLADMESLVFVGEPVQKSAEPSS